MKLPINLQLLQACAAILTGAALGVCYDILKIMRLRLHRWLVTAFLDLIFWLTTALILFAIGLGPGQGQLRIFMLVCALGGAAAYFAGLSPFVLVILKAIFDFLDKIVGYVAIPLVWTGKQIKKSEKFYKNIFQKLRKCFTIASNSKTDVPVYKNLTGGEETGGETKAGKYYY